MSNTLNLVNLAKAYTNNSFNVQLQSTTLPFANSLNLDNLAANYTVTPSIPSIPSIPSSSSSTLTTQDLNKLQSIVNSLLSTKQITSEYAIVSFQTDSSSTSGTIKVLHDSGGKVSYFKNELTVPECYTFCLCDFTAYNSSSGNGTLDVTITFTDPSNNTVTYELDESVSADSYLFDATSSSFLLPSVITNPTTGIELTNQGIIASSSSQQMAVLSNTSYGITFNNASTDATFAVNFMLFIFYTNVSNSTISLVNTPSLTSITNALKSFSIVPYQFTNVLTYYYATDKSVSSPFNPQIISNFGYPIAVYPTNSISFTISGNGATAYLFLSIVISSTISTSYTITCDITNNGQTPLSTTAATSSSIPVNKFEMVNNFSDFSSSKPPNAYLSTGTYNVTFSISSNGGSTGISNITTLEIAAYIVLVQ